MENSKPQQERTKIISQEKFWGMNKEERDKFEWFFIDKVSIQYSQKVHNDFQELTIETDDAGGGRFFNIKTDKFSFNDEEEFKDLIRDFLMRAKIEGK